MATVFTLEAMFAKHGDALLLHYGPWARPKWVLVDGGPPGVYQRHLKPRMRQLREEFDIADDRAIPLRMVLVSHIDEDHIGGVLDLFREVLTAKERRRPRPFKIHTLWHNSFDDILGNTEQRIVSRMAATVASKDRGGLPVPPMTADAKAVVASTGQGRELRNAAKKLGVNLNTPFRGLIVARRTRRASLGHGLTLTVIGPLQERVEKYQKRWDKDLKKILKKEKDSAKASAFEDQSPFNLASICVLAEMKKKRMLLTGDARGDYILDGLRQARLLPRRKPLHVDVLKVPHHGSDRNVEESFFKRVTADHYVISGDGGDGNPERTTLEMIARARGDAPYTVHFTFTADAHRHERNATRRKALKRVDTWVRNRPASCSVVHRENDPDVHCITIDLLDPLYED